MLAMSSTSSSSHHQPTNPFSATNLGGGSPWPLFLEDPLATLLPNYQNHHNLLATHFIPPQADANYSSHHHDHGHYQSSTSPPPPPPTFVDLPPRSSTGEDHEEQAVKKDSSSSGGTVITTMKKLNHNASERHRRKKINTLYSSLRSMLPPSDHHPTKKLSIPNTVSRVLKYIPELQQQVEALARKKKELLSAIANDNQLNNKKEHVDDHNSMNSDTTNNSSKSLFTSSSSSLASSSSTVSTSWLSEEEVMVQISIAKSNDTTFDHISEILVHLQETGLALVNSSSFQSFQGRVFYSLHLKMEGTHGVGAHDSKALSEKLFNLYEQVLSRRPS